MTKKKGQNFSDAEFEAYLDGEHKLSEAYAELEEVSTPKSLDEKILTQARDSVSQKSVDRHSRSYKPYASAATVFLCLFVTFLYVRNPDVEKAVDFGSQNGNVRPAIPVTLERSGTDAKQVDLQGEQGEQRAQAVQEVQGPGIQAQRQALNTQRITIETPQPIEATLELRDVAQDFVEETQNEAEQEGLEEIRVTASRIAPVPQYRAAPDIWLVEIRRLLNTENFDQADREAQFFLEQYPEIDLDREQFLENIYNDNFSFDRPE